MQWQFLSCNDIPYDLNQQGCWLISNFVFLKFPHPPTVSLSFSLFYSLSLSTPSLPSHLQSLSCHEFFLFLSSTLIFSLSPPPPPQQPRKNRSTSVILRRSSSRFSTTTTASGMPVLEDEPMDRHRSLALRDVS